jgi:Na+/melibiose symporter-like transporter
MFSIFPAVLAVLSAVAIVFYRLSGDEVSQLEHELAERR